MTDNPRSRPLSLANKIIAGVLLAVPMVTLAIVPVYAKDGPRL